MIHGRGVEVRDDWFFEGAWDGSFERGEFDKASACCGTGGRIKRDSAEFVTPTHSFRALVYSEKDDTHYLSNSIAFVLQLTGDLLPHGRGWAVKEQFQDLFYTR